MRTLLLTPLFAASLALAEPTSVTAPSLASAPRVTENSVTLFSAPQVGHLGVDGRIAFGARLQVELGGWNLFDDARAGTFLRGGWLGVRGRVWQSDSIAIDVAGRALASQEQGTNTAMAGLWAASGSQIRVFRWFSVLPDFETSWLGGLYQARVSNEFRFEAGDWRLGGHGGAQLWVRDGVVTVAPLAELSLGWRHHFRAVDLQAGAGLAMTRDPSAVLAHPLLVTPEGALQPWAFVRFGVVVN